MTAAIAADLRGCQARRQSFLTNKTVIRGRVPSRKTKKYSRRRIFVRLRAAILLSGGRLVAEEITQLLIRWGRGDQEALGQLMPLVYNEMRRMARGYLSRQVGSPILQPTVLVHEAYLRLVNQEEVEWQGRAQFFGLAAKIMRELLIDHVRRQQAIKHGGGAEQVSLSHAEPMGQLTTFDLLALDEALNRLAALDPQHSRVVELRFFGGLTIQETADTLGISSATVERSWNLARAWLHREMVNR